MIRRFTTALICVAMLAAGAAVASAEQSTEDFEAQPVGLRQDLRRIHPPLRIFPDGTTRQVLRGFTDEGTTEVCPGVTSRGPKNRAAHRRMHILPSGQQFIVVGSLAFRNARAAQRALAIGHRQVTMDCASYVSDGFLHEISSRPAPLRRVGDSRRGYRGMVTRLGESEAGAIYESAIYRFGRVLVQVVYVAPIDDRIASLWRQVIRNSTRTAERLFG